MSAYRDSLAPAARARYDAAVREAGRLLAEAGYDQAEHGRPKGAETPQAA